MFHVTIHAQRMRIPDAVGLRRVRIEGTSSKPLEPATEHQRGADGALVIYTDVSEVGVFTAPHAGVSAADRSSVMPARSFLRATSTAHHTLV